MTALSLVEHALGLDRRAVVWVMTTIALAAPLVLLPLVDRFTRKR